MAKLLPNRLSETLTDKQIEQFRTAIQTAIEALPKKPVISNDDFAKIPKKGETRVKEADQMIRVVRNYPQFLPVTLNLEEVEKDNTLYDQIRDLKLSYLKVLEEHIDVLLGISGGEEMNAYGRFTENVKTGAKDNNAAAISALNEIDKVEKPRLGKPTAKKVEK